MRPTLVQARADKLGIGHIRCSDILKEMNKRLIGHIIFKYNYFTGKWSELPTEEIML
jgi:hypothetical protein